MSWFGRERNTPPGDDVRDWLGELSVELDRSRRYDHPFVLIRVPLAASQAARHTDHCCMLRSALRAVDRCWSAAGSIYVLLPESTHEMAEGLLARIRVALPELRLDEAETACFPDDALTGGGLLDAVQRGEPRAPRSTPVPRSATHPAVDLSRPLPARSLTPAHERRRLRDAASGS